MSEGDPTGPMVVRPRVVEALAEVGRWRSASEARERRRLQEIEAEEAWLRETRTQVDRRLMAACESREAVQARLAALEAEAVRRAREAVVSGLAMDCRVLGARAAGAPPAAAGLVVSVESRPDGVRTLTVVLPVPARAAGAPGDEPPAESGQPAALVARVGEAVRGALDDLGQDGAAIANGSYAGNLAMRVDLRGPGLGDDLAETLSVHLDRVRGQARELQEARLELYTVWVLPDVVGPDDVQPLDGAGPAPCAAAQGPEDLELDEPDVAHGDAGQGEPTVQAVAAAAGGAAGTAAGAGPQQAPPAAAQDVADEYLQLDDSDEPSPRPCAPAAPGRGMLWAGAVLLVVAILAWVVRAC